MRKEKSMKDEKTLTQEDTEAAGYPCSDSKGSDITDVAPVDVIEDGE